MTSRQQINQARDNTRILSKNIIVDKILENTVESQNYWWTDDYKSQE